MILYFFCVQILKKKKRQKKDQPTNPPNFQAKRANKPFIVLGLIDWNIATWQVHIRKVVSISFAIIAFMWGQYFVWILRQEVLGVLDCNMCSLSPEIMGKNIKYCISVFYLRHLIIKDNIPVNPCSRSCHNFNFKTYIDSHNSYSIMCLRVMWIVFSLLYFQAWSLTKGDTLQQHTRCLTAGSSVPETKVYLTNCQSNDVKQVSGKSITHHVIFQRHSESLNSKEWEKDEQVKWGQISFRMNCSLTTRRGGTFVITRSTFICFRLFITHKQLSLISIFEMSENWL